MQSHWMPSIPHTPKGLSIIHRVSTLLKITGTAIATMQRRPAAKSRQMTSQDLDDLEGGGAAGNNGGSPYMVRQASTASRASNGDASDLNLDNGSAAALFSDDSQGKRRKTQYRASLNLSALGQFSGDTLRVYALILLGLTVVLYFLCSTTWSILLLVMSACCFGTIVSLWLARNVLSKDDGTAEMRAVSDPIREGAEGFLKVQYTAIAKFAVPLAGLIIFCVRDTVSIQ